MLSWDGEDGLVSDLEGLGGEGGEGDLVGGLDGEAEGPLGLRLLGIGESGLLYAAEGVEEDLMAVYGLSGDLSLLKENI
jgi:hypothetical protein